MQISAVIFDLDGTVIDSEEAWDKAFVTVLKSLGVESPNHKPEVTGISVKENWRELISKFNINTDKNLDELESLTYNEYSKLLPEVNLMDGVVEFIEKLKSSDIQVALATSSNWEITDKILNKFQISKLFDYITTGDEVFNKKPDPEIYFKAADKMNLEPGDCLVVENSQSGIMAGKEAGMKVIAIDSTGERNDLDEADITVGSFPEITAQVISEL